MNILGSLCSGVFSQVIKQYTSSVFDLNIRQDLLSYYRFYQEDVSGVNVANYATGLPIYDSSLVLTEAVVNTDNKFPNGSLYSPSGSTSYFKTGPFVQTSTTGLTLTGWFKLSTSSFNGGAYGYVLRYLANTDFTSNPQVYNVIELQPNVPGQVTLSYTIFSGSNYYRIFVSSGTGYIDNNWYFFSVVFTPTKLTYSITPYSSGNTAYSSTNTLTTTLNILTYDSAGNYQQNLTTTFSALGLTNMMPTACSRYGIYGTGLVENYYVNGGIADMRIYDSALTSTNITSLYDYIKNTTYVSNIAALSTTTNNVTVSFVSITTVDFFVVVATSSNGSKFTQKGTSSPITLSGLQSGTNYSITVLSSLNSMISASPSSISVTTLTPYIVDASLSLFYPFDISSNNYTPNYATGFQLYDASFNNGATISTSQFITGSGSAYLPSSTAQVRLGNFTSSGTNMSISFWFYVGSYPQNVSYFALNPSTTNMLANGIEMHGYSTNVLRIGIVNSSNQFATFNAPSANAWHHMVWTMKGSTWKIYIDNVSQSLTYTNGGPPAPTAVTYIYNSIGNSQYPYNLSSITGYISDFRIYDLVLSTTQVYNLYLNRNTIAVYNFTSSTFNNTLHNYASLNYDATLYGLANITATQTAVDILSLYTNTGYVASSPSFQISNTNGFSLCTWVYFTTMNSPNCLISLGTTYYSYSSGDGIGLYVDDTGVYAQYWFGNSNSNFATSKYGISSQFLNRWNHVACTVSTTASTNTTTTWSIYINGILMGTTIETNNVYNYYNGQNMNQLNIGTNINKTATHSAYYNDIKVYNRVLSVSEINTMAIQILNNLQVPTSNLLGWFDAYQLYSTDTTSITTWKDKSSQNSTATLNTCDYVTAINSTYPVPAVYFSSTSSYMLTNVSNSLILTTICVVVTFTQNNTSIWLTPSDSSNAYSIRLGIGNSHTIINTYNTNTGTAFAPIQNSAINVPTLFVVTINGYDGTINCWQNGTLLHRYYIGGVSGSGTGTIRYGSTANGTTTTEGPSVNYLSELMIFNIALTTTQITTYEGYLANKWGIQSLLPSRHPYYNTTPTLSVYTVPSKTSHNIPYFLTNVKVGGQYPDGVVRYSNWQYDNGQLYTLATDLITKQYDGKYILSSSSQMANGYSNLQYVFLPYYNNKPWATNYSGQYTLGSAPYYTYTNTTTGYKTVVDGGNVYGEWLQLDCPNAFVLDSYTMGTYSTDYLPSSWVMAGSNSSTGPWTSIPNILNNAPGYNCNNVYTIPVTYLTSGNTTLYSIILNSLYFTIPTNTTTSYSSYRLILTSAIRPDRQITLNNFYMTSYIDTIYTTPPSPISIYNPINWFPFENDGIDYGSNPQTLITVGNVPFISIDNKKCIYFDQNPGYNYVYFNFSPPTKFTFCFWYFNLMSFDASPFAIDNANNVGSNTLVLSRCSWTGAIIGAAMPILRTNFSYTAYYNDSEYGYSGKWVHMAVSIDQSTYTMKLYINGINLGGYVGTSAFQNTQNVSVLLGVYFGFQGGIRQLGIYNTVLTDAQINGIYYATM